MSLRMEGDLPKGDGVTPYKAYLVKWVTRAGEGGVKKLKKWVTLFMDGPFQYFICHILGTLNLLLPSCKGLGKHTIIFLQDFY